MAAVPPFPLRREQFSGKALRAYLALALGALSVASATAHDFWIEPSAFRPVVGERVPLRLLVGQDFKGEAALYVPEQFRRYSYVGPRGERKVEGTLGDDPAGAVRIDAPGLYVVGYYSEKFEATFDSLEEFESYLTAEGLARNLALAKKRAGRGAILERYTRCAKSLIDAGAGPAQADRLLGYPLELLSESKPYRGERRLRMQLRYRAKPLADALVVAFRKHAPQEKLRARTDRDGRVVFELDQPGTWLVTSVHMIPAPLLSRADWESFWASLTFELPDPRHDERLRFQPDRG